MILFLTALNFLLNPEVIEKKIMPMASWKHLHGASDTHLGMGLLYYTLVYTHECRHCVCLGSGDGFVPRLIREAQKDAGLVDAVTYLIDGNLGPYGRPNWIKETSFFKTHYPEIKILLMQTKEAALSFAKSPPIDYLHIDADRSAEGILQDFHCYLPLMSSNGIITIHDTAYPHDGYRVVEKLRKQGFSLINMDRVGTGTTVIYLNEKTPSSP